VILSLLAVVLASPEPAKPAAWTELLPMVGGVWKGKVGDFPVEIRYQYDASLKTIQSSGTLGDVKKPFARLAATLGIDPKTSEVFYFDNHNGNELFFGSVKKEESTLVFDFKSLTGTPGHWVTKVKVPILDDYTSTMYGVGPDGKLTQQIEIKLHREKD
jgi:hypothetical protein